MRHPCPARRSSGIENAGTWRPVGAAASPRSSGYPRSAETGSQKPALIRWEWRIRSVANKAGQAGFPAREAPQPDASVCPEPWYRRATRTRREPAPLPPLAGWARSFWRCGGRCRRRRIGNKRARRPRKTAGTSVRNKELLSSQTHAPAGIRCRFAASAPVRTKL